VRNSDLAWHAGVQRDYPVLSAAILSGASAQIRNMATTAGNLMQRTRCPYFRDNVSPCNKREPGTGCAAREGFNRMHAILGGSEACIATHPSDLCVALAVLDAEIIVHRRDAEHRIPFRDFHLLPGTSPEKEHALERGDLIMAVRVPTLPAGSRQRYVKLRDRESFEFALASAAVVLWLEGKVVADVRLALGGVATKPWRCPAAEAALRGAPATVESFRMAAAAAVRDAQPYEHNGFKVSLVQQAIVRALTEAVASEVS
jgi:xanthine dehydrogenase YagS FAD-binding subunit